MKLLFISRAYPPVVGGIENQNFELAQQFQKKAGADLLVNTRGKKFLPLFLPYALIKTLLTAKKYDAILLGDGVLAIIGFFVRFYTRKPLIASVIHGLDITYKNPVYQVLWVHIFIPSLNKIIAVSQETKNIAIQHGLSERKIVVIPNGINTSVAPANSSRGDLSRLLGFDTNEKIILLTNGRLAKRKGARWFLANVLPTLPQNIHYVLSGDGPEKKDILETLKTHGLENRVSVLGRVSDEDKNTLLNTIDIFIQPNIVVPGDMEGFGIAVIEATLAARPVIASNIEGLKDAVANGENGIPLPSGDTQAWRETILDLASHKEKRISLGEKFQQYTKKYFSWNTITEKYLEALQKG